MYESLICVLRSLFKEYCAIFQSSSDPDDQSSQPTNTLQSSREQFSERMEIVDDCVGYKRIDVRYKQKLNKLGVREKRERDLCVQT
ncbi:unnamed protein product [Brassica rapa]|uniref:Uncharacterized protein n=1 Tax=Brassica campestris TaxID=3711 RepID=A0A3P6BQP0_BRACM|nr:unnamed protein product [Brassica rapa]VDD03324.1 unnamed protein product [Brassica rapa]